MQRNIVIAVAKRTPIGSFMGSLTHTPAREMGKQLLEAVLQLANESAKEVKEVIMGQVLQAGCGQNIARQVAIDAGLDVSVPASTINQVCASGLRSVVTAWQNIACGTYECAVAGGVESMSMSPHSLLLRTAYKMGNVPVNDTMLSDGLIDAFKGYHMGVTAENVAKKHNISRQQQDAFSLASHQKAKKAAAEGRFKDEIVPLALRDKIFEADEHIRLDINMEALSRLRPVFIKEEGTVTAGNASGLNDGAALLLMMTAEKANMLGVKPLATLKAWAQVGVEPEYMGLGPIEAMRLCARNAGWQLPEVELFEVNEAFASQAIAVLRTLELDEDKVNVNGGAIALGHPIGASGARILVTLIHEMHRRKAKKGMASLCVGGGMGIAVAVEV